MTSEKARPQGQMELFGARLAGLLRLEYSMISSAKQNFSHQIQEVI